MARRPTKPSLFGRPPQREIASERIFLGVPFSSGGPPGSPGVDGRDAGIKYAYSNNTASSDPGSGILKFDSVTFGSITKLRISETDGDGNAISAALATWDDSSSTVKGRLEIHKAGAATPIAIFQITGTLTDNGTWDEFNVTPVAGALPANGDDLRLSFARTGDAGVGGATGRDGGFKYTYSNNTVASDPGAGGVKFNAAVTAMYISETDADGQSLAAFLATIDDSTSAIRGHIVFRKAGAAAPFAVLTITGALIDNGAWDSVPVALIAGGSFVNGDTMMLQFIRTGDAGNVGPSGASGSGWLTPCRAATTANVTLAGSAPNVVDGVTLALNDRILVKNQTTASQNGIYTVTTLGTGANGTWTRATDADATGEITGGTSVKVQEGTVNADTEWVVTTDGTITIGTTGITWKSHLPIVGTYFAPPMVPLGNSSGWGPNQFWLTEIKIPRRCLITGVGYWVFTQSGNVRAAMYDSTGTRIANRSTAHAVPAAGQFDQVPFDSPVTVEPGIYYIGLIPTLAAWAVYYGYTMCPSKQLAGPGADATPASITPPTVPEPNSVPAMSTY